MSAEQHKSQPTERDDSRIVSDDGPNGTDDGDDTDSLWSEVTADALENGPTSPEELTAPTDELTPIDEYKLWRDEATLEYLYWDKEMSHIEIAERIGCSQNTVFRWKGRYNVGARYEGITSASVHEGARRLRQTDKGELYEMVWGNGMTTAEVGEHFDTNASTVSRHLGRLGIPVIDNGSRNAWVFRMLSRERLYEIYWGEGMTHSQIADRYNVGQQFISRVFNERDIPQEPHRPSDFDGTTIPQMYEWPDDRDDEPHPQHQPLPENPDGSKYVAETQTMQEEKLYELHWGYGCSAEHIAAIADSNGQTIRKRMREYGIPVREWGTHTKWEPHHGVPPKYEWPNGEPPSESDEDDNFRKGVWRAPAGAE